MQRANDRRADNAEPKGRAPQRAAATPRRRTEAAEGAAEPEGVAVWAVNLPRVQPSR